MADVEATFVAWESTFGQLQFAVNALDYTQLRPGVNNWIRCAMHCVRAVPLMEDDDGCELPSESHRDRIWRHMCDLSNLGCKLCAATQWPTQLESARRCVALLADGMICGAIGDTNLHSAWEDLCMYQRQYCFTQPFEGAPDASMRMLLARCASYNTGDVYWSEIQDYLQVNVDYRHRMLKRLLLLIAALGQFHCIDSVWHDLARDATFYTSEDYNDTLTLTKVLKSLMRPMSVWPRKECLLQPLRDPNARQMVLLMRKENRVQLAQRPRPSLATRQDCILREAKGHIQVVKTALYKSLWRKWFTLHAIAFYWLENTQKRLCAPGGAGRAADMAVIRQMGLE